MLSAIRKHIFKGSKKNESAPQILIILCVYTVITSLYTWMYFSTGAMIIRFGLSIFVVLSYVLIERSPLGATSTAFLSPFMIISVLTIGAIYFRGDFLLFTYSIGIAMISLTYLKPNALAAYVISSSTMFAVILFVARINVLGQVFTPIYNILYYTVSVALNLLIYIFCKSYVNALGALTEAKNEASQAAQAKGNFLANMSHEIRTPLNAIVGLTEAELRRELPHADVENLRKIHASGNLLMGIINDILDMSKIESGKFELSPTAYNLVDMLYDVVTLNVVHKKSKPVDFIVSVDEGAPRGLMGDELRIKQLLGNLLSNAFKYTLEGSVALRITWQPAPAGATEDTVANAAPGAVARTVVGAAPGAVTSPMDGAAHGADASTVAGAAQGAPHPVGRARLTFEIADTGIGIREDDLKKLFTEYAQVNQQSTRGVEGTGLGLAICKGLVELMDGEIATWSEYGKGSVFTVHVHQDIVDGAPVGAETAGALADFTYVPEYRGLRVEYTPMPYVRALVVDDVYINLEVAAACLEPYEIKVDCIDNGGEAVRLIMDGEPHYNMIFMDHMMPGMDGIEATRAIRDIGTPYAASIPIIALTANALAGNEKTFIENGFQGFLSKPIDLVKLDAVLRAWA